LSDILGPDGRPLSVQDATRISQQNAGQVQLNKAQLNLIVARWKAFYCAETAELALDTIQGRGLIEQGFNPDGVLKLYTAISYASESIPEDMDDGQRDAVMLQLCEYIVGVAVGHPSVIGRLEFVGTLAALEAGLIRRKTGNEAQEARSSAEGATV
jgi:hypothetical protein